MELEVQLFNFSPQLIRLVTALSARKRSSVLDRRPTRPHRSEQNAERRLGAHAVQSLLESYRDGAAVSELMATYVLGKGTVLNMLRRHGLAVRNQGLNEDDLPSVVQLYADGWSLTRLGKRFGCDACTVRRRLLEAGVVMRAPWERV